MASLTPPPPSLLPHQRDSSSDFYYFIVTVAIVAVILVVSNIIAFARCSQTRLAQNFEHVFLDHRGIDSTVGRITQELIPLTKYSKAEAYDTDCSVCLMGFMEGEEVRQLPRCKHSFHAQCIDMWLYSHSSCPVCRTAVEGLPPPVRCPRAPAARRPLFTESSNLGQVVVAIM